MKKSLWVHGDATPEDKAKIYRHYYEVRTEINRSLFAKGFRTKAEYEAAQRVINETYRERLERIGVNAAA